MDYNQAVATAPVIVITVDFDQPPMLQVLEVVAVLPQASMATKVLVLEAAARCC
jgi:hypothetical protein